MKALLRTILLAFALAVPASAQDAITFFTEADVEAATGLSEVEMRCMGERTANGFVFFDDVSDQIIQYDPLTDTGSVLVSAMALDDAAGIDVVQCRDLHVDDDANSDLFLALADASNQDVAVQVDFLTPTTIDAVIGLTDPTNTTDNGDSINAITRVGGTIYIARAEFFGAPEDGVYSLTPGTADQVPGVVVQDADLDLVDITPNVAGNALYGTSSEFGDGNFENVVVMITDLGGTPALMVGFDPFDGAGAIFTNGSDGGIEEIAVANVNDGSGPSEKVFVVNNSFGAPDGETIGRFDPDGSNPVVVATQSSLVAEASVSATSIRTAGNNGYLYQDSAGTLFFLTDENTEETNNGNEQVISIFGALVTPNEDQPLSYGEDLAIEAAPNPFAGQTSVRILVAEAGPVTVTAYDLLGRRVATLFDGAASQELRVAFDAQDLPAGTYLIRAETETAAQTYRVTVLR